MGALPMPDIIALVENSLGIRTAPSISSSIVMVKEHGAVRPTTGARPCQPDLQQITNVFLEGSVRMVAMIEYPPECNSHDGPTQR